MMSRLQIIPHGLHFIVYCQLGVAFRIFKSQPNSFGDKLTKDKGIHTFALILRINADQQQVKNFIVVPFQSPV